MLSSLGGHNFLSSPSCLILASQLFSATPGLQKGSTTKQLLWIMLRGRAALLEKSLKENSSQASTLCQQLSALITHCQLAPTEQLRDLQMKVNKKLLVNRPVYTLIMKHNTKLIIITILGI